MQENTKTFELAHEDLELVDLGDAAVETRQPYPDPLFVDSIQGWGEWGLA
jgi:hypothetical protein